MRDIRDDLNDRVKFLQEQIRSLEAQFAKHLAELKQEHDSKLKALKANLEAVTTLIEAEQRRVGNTASAPNAQQQPHPPASRLSPEQQSPQQEPTQTPQGRPRTSLADLIGLQRTG